MSFAEWSGRVCNGLYAVVVLASAGGLAAACGGGSPDSGDGGAISAGPLDEVDFAIKYAAAICNNVDACCKRANHAPSQSDCLTTIANSLSQRFAKVRTNLDYDRVAAGHCVAEVAVGVKACDVKALANAKSCDDVYRGKLVPGTKCSSGIECALPTGLAAQCSEGVCEVVAPPEPPAKEGKSCDPFTNTGGCESGLACDQSIYVCVVPGAAVGQDCSHSTCKAGLTCDDFSLTCRIGATEGACYAGYGCALGSHFCDSCTLTCTKKLADGEACQGFEECASGNCYPSGCGPELFGVEDGLCGDQLSPPPIAPRSCPTDAKPTADFAWSDPVANLGAVTKVWGTAADDLYAVSDRRELFHSSNGSTWDRVALPGGTAVTDIWGLNADEIYATTSTGLLQGSAAAGWVTVEVPASFQLTDIFAVSGTTAALFVSGFNVNSGASFKVLRRSGGVWTDLGFASGTVGALWPRENGDLCAAGGQGYLLLGAGWLGYPLPSLFSLGGAGNDCYFGSVGGLHRIDADGFITRTPLLIDPSAEVSSIWGYDAHTVFLTVATPLSSGEGALFQGDGDATWTKIARLRGPRAVWGPSPDELYVGTDYGVVRGVRR